MKQGNQFYLEAKLFDEQNKAIDVSSVLKVQFNIGDLTKTYDGINEDVVLVDDTFRIWLTEEETFEFGNTVEIDCRVLFKNNTILGSEINKEYFIESLNKVSLND